MSCSPEFAISDSEKVFWRKVLDIYATSVDYDPRAETSVVFFQTVQNKMHWAAHGMTAAELIYQRADASQPFMGMKSFSGIKPTKAETQIAKNYLAVDELEILNRMVTAYLEFAELQALRRKPTHMVDWIQKLDDFLRMTDSNILTHSGQISHADAIDKAELEYRKYKERTKDELSEVERHFLQSIEKVEKKIKKGKEE